MECKKHKGPPPRGEIGPRIMHLSKLVRKSFNEAVPEQGLFSGQQDIVLVLVENPGITLSRLAEELGVSSATASVSIKRMEKAGFITKNADEKDARIVRLYPTAKAKSAPDNSKNRLYDIERILLAGISPEKAGELSDMLDTAINNLTERGEGR